MALIKCKSCGGDISDSADVCVHCGANVSKNIICPDCEKENPESNDICFNCGAKLKEKEIVVNNTPKIKNGNKLPFIIVIVVLALVVIIFGLKSFGVFDSGIEIPYLGNTAKADANSILISKELIPNYVYEYNDYVEEGNVIRTSPEFGDKLRNGDTVTIYISKGPDYIKSAHSTISWWNIDGNDNWEFYSPYIKDGVLYIECQPKLATTIKWHRYKDGKGFGNASINDTFDKTVPIDIITDSETLTAKQQGNIKLAIPTNDLDVNKPTTLYLKLYAKKGKEDITIRQDFSISW